MARPIPFEAPKRDAKLELLHKLEKAPADHAAALLDAYDLLQALHDRGLIDIARGLVGSGDDVLDIAVNQAMQPPAVRAMRNLLVMFNLLAAIDPDTLKKFTSAIPQAVQLASQKTRPPGVVSLMKSSIFDEDVRRGMGAMLEVLRGVGLGMKQSQS